MKCLQSALPLVPIQANPINRWYLINTSTYMLRRMQKQYMFYSFRTACMQQQKCAVMPFWKCFTWNLFCIFKFVKNAVFSLNSELQWTLQLLWILFLADTINVPCFVITGFVHWRLQWYRQWEQLSPNDPTGLLGTGLFLHALLFLASGHCRLLPFTEGITQQTLLNA